MPVAAHIARLREKVGHDLLLLPSVSVLPMDPQGRVLLVHQAEFQAWGTIGGAVDVDESPADAAHRETAEEIGTEVELTAILGAVGGPHFRITYPNGDQCAYVNTIFGARIIGRPPQPDDDEVDALRWFTRTELRSEPSLGSFATSTFRALGWI